MAREVDLTGKLSPEDILYIRQRPWMVKDAELLGHDISDAVFGGVEPDMSGTATSSYTSEDLRAGTPDPAEMVVAPPVDESDDDYDDWKKDELVAELDNRELVKSGNVTELIARLRAHDKESSE